MLYHQFNNIHQIFLGIMERKLMESIESTEKKYFEWNWSTGMKRDGECIFGHKECQSCWIVYETKCCTTHCVYIGQTQRFFKKRIMEHNRDAIKFTKEKKLLDSFVDHFGRMLKHMGGQIDQAVV